MRYYEDNQVFNNHANSGLVKEAQYYGRKPQLVTSLRKNSETIIKMNSLSTIHGNVRCSPGNFTYRTATLHSCRSTESLSNRTQSLLAGLPVLGRLAP